MADLRIDFEWLSCPDKDPLEEATTARLEIYIDDFWRHSGAGRRDRERR